MRGPRLNTFRSRVARRLFAAFVICALLPIVAVGALVFRELDRIVTERATDRLASLSAGYGMQVIGRLTAADDVLHALIAQTSNASGGPTRDTGSRLLERVRTADSLPEALASMGIALASDRGPQPDAAQLDALRRGRPILLWRTDAASSPHVFLLREAPASGRLILGELAPDKLWGSPDDLPDGSHIIVLPPRGPPLYVPPGLPRALVPALRSAFAAPVRRTFGRPSALWRSPDGAWRAYRWEAFLRGAYTSPPWNVIAVERRRALLGEIGHWRVIFPAALLAALLLALLLAAMQIRRFFAPIEDLIEATRRLARGAFDTSIDESSPDELGELARSFNSMTSSLEHQFTTLATVAEVDRLLLASSEFERVLDALLPRMATVMGCSSVSVFLFEADSPARVRAYDFGASSADVLPVRRFGCDLEPLRGALASSGFLAVEPHDPGGRDIHEWPGLLEPLAQLGSRRFELWSLRRGAEIAGMLCLGYPDGGSPRAGPTHQGREFADRLSVVLANVAHGEALYRQAHFDALTQLPNRLLFRDRLAGDLARVRDGGRGALLYVDLDRFKRVNDTAGHGAGDELLKVAGQRIEACLREGDTIARLGGDEFAVVLHRIEDPTSARNVAERIIAAVGKPIAVADREHYVGASIGIALFPDDGDAIDVLLRNADIALYRAKEAGRGTMVFYEPDMNARVQARASLETGLHRALREGHFELHWQPIMAARKSRLIGAEALLRRTDGTAAERAPAAFIPVAEESGLIIEIGGWVIDTALRQLASWLAHGIAIPKISVNVSPRQLRDPAFAGSVRDCLRRHAVDPVRLQLEVTESIMAEGAAAERSLRELTAVGVTIALDDFGTGYSSLSYLRTLPIDSVKIDRSFVTDVPESRTACQLIETIVAMCRSLDKLVIAEGVETPAQLAFLAERGCDGIQGYLLGKPAPAQHFAARHLHSRAEPSHSSNSRTALSNSGR